MRKSIKFLIPALFLVIIAVAIIQNSNLNEMETRRDAYLDVLREDEGRYDAQSIVLRGISRAEAQTLSEKLCAELRMTSDGKYARLTLPSGTTIADVFSNDEYLKYTDMMSADYKVSLSDIEEDTDGNYVSRPKYNITDDGYSLQTYLDYLGLGEIWQSYKGSGVCVAVIDTGIDTDHPEFAGRISTYSYNATEDRIVKDYTDENGNPDWSLIEDEQGHGTAVAGVIFAAMDGVGTVGIAPEAEILVIKAECDENGEFERTSDLVFGLYYAIERDADVVNMSFGTEENHFSEATRLAYDSDILCVASAGNDSTSKESYPAADPYVIGVGSIDENWNLEDYSNYGNNSDVVAPGTVYTTALGGGYATKHGTSMSSPAVAAVLALYKDSSMYDTNDMVFEILYASTVDLGDLGEDWDFGYGAVDTMALIKEERGCVTFEMLSDEVQNEEAIFIKGHTLQNIPEPERLYAVFDGWYYDETCTEEYRYYEDKFTDDITLYAKWANEDDGVPYTYVILEDGTVEIRSYTGKRRYITIPEMIDDRVVSSIGDFAFSGENAIREITLPEGLTNIGRYAFEKCTELRGITIPSGVTNIGENAFSENVRLSYVMFEEGSELNSLGDGAFSYCVSLRELVLPASLESVNGSAFFGASSLKNIYVDGLGSYIKSVDGVLYSADKRILIAYPSAHASSYSIDDNAVAIGAYAFAYAEVGTVDISGISEIGDYAFTYSGLNGIIIPSSVTKIGTNAFESCRSLSSVTLSENLEIIDESVFRSCDNLKSVTIPKNVKKIGKTAFSSSGLIHVEFQSDSELTTIGERAFSGTSIEEIALPGSLERIESMAFSGCTELKYVFFNEGSNLSIIGSGAFMNSGLMEIALPEGLSEIGELSFSETLLSDVTIPASVTKLGGGAFSACGNLTYIKVADGNSVYHDIDGVVYTADNSVIVAYPAGALWGEYSLQAETREIEKYTFAKTHNLITVILPEGLTYIGQYSFSNSYIDYINLPNSLLEIGAYSFENCTDMFSIVIPDNVITIGRYAFAECNNLYGIYFNSTSKMKRLGNHSLAYSGIESITIPASVSTMGQEVFKGCSKLHTVVFSENSELESISAYMFDGCSNLQNIIFYEGSSLTSIQAHGLEGIANLHRVDLSFTNLENIDNYAFRFCNNLSIIDLPDTVTNIGRYAFYGCTKIKEMSIPQNVEHIGSYAFLGTDDVNLYFASDILPEYLDENWDVGTLGYYVGVQSIETSGDFRYALLTTGGISIIEYLGDETTVNLAALDLGGDIVSIGGSAFKNSSVRKITLPSTLREIYASAFYGSELKSVTIPASVTFIGRESFAYTPIQSITFENNSSLKNIEAYAFSKTANLSSVTIPATVTSLGTGVFMESGLSELYFEDGTQLSSISERAFAKTKLSEVFIPDSVTLIDDNAFYGIETLSYVEFGSADEIRIMSNVFYGTGLREVYIPENVTYIGEYSFVGLTSLKEFEVSENNPNYKDVSGLLLTKNGRKLVAVPAGMKGELTVPVSVEEIGFGAFENTSLSAVNFDPSANILTFGYRAFFGAKNLTEIKVPATVVSIDYYAFAYCENLCRVIFEDGSRVKGVYEGAFCGDINLTEVILPETVVEISDFAFYGCSQITEIQDLPIEYISDYAYAYTGIRDTLVIPEEITEIGNYAFLGTRVSSVLVPDTNKFDLIIGIGAFEDCNLLKEITLPFIGRSFEDNEITWLGYIFGAGSYAANETYVPKSLESVTLTDGIAEIGRGAFAYCTGICEINLPHSVTKLYSDAFKNTSAKYELTNTIQLIYKDNWGEYPSTSANSDYFGKGISGELVLADGLESIAGFTFERCSNLVGVYIPDSVNSVYNSVFLYCNSLEYVRLPDGIDEIYNGTFGGCESLVSVEIPDSVKAIGSTAFENCYSLEEIVLPEGLESIGYHAFMSCNSLTSVDIPDSVRTIESYSFGMCQSLYSVDLPDSLETIKDMAFYYCRSLTSLTIPKNVSTIEYNAFYHCDSLCQVENLSNLSIEIGSEENGYVAYYAKVLLDSEGNKIFSSDNSGVEYVDTPDGFMFEKSGDNYTLVAYKGNLKTVTLPSSINGKSYSVRNFRGGAHIIIPEELTVIDDYAFFGNTVIKSITLHDNVTSIGEYAFKECYNLKEINLPDSLTYIGSSAFFGCSIENVVIPSGVSEISVGTFEACTYLKSVTLNQNVTSIRAWAFRNCDSLTEIIIPESVKLIDREAFAYCDLLKSVTLSEGLETIDDKAFTLCPMLKEIKVPESVTSIGSGAFMNTDIVFEGTNSNFTNIDGIIYNSSLTKIVAVTPSASGEIVIPYGVTQISEYTFQDNSTITSVTIPGSVYYVFSGAFKNCTALETVIMEEGVTRVEGQTFKDCVNLRNVTIPKTVTSLPYGIFENCTSLTEVNLSEGLIEIGSYAFNGCTGLKEIKLPDSLLTIGGDAFYGCKSLQSIDIPGNVVSIGYYSFAYCTALESAYLPDSLEGIGAAAFTSCSNLKSVRLPEGIKTIPDNLFGNCISLESITLPDSVTRINQGAFWYCSSLLEIIMPDSLEYIEDRAFMESALTSVRIPEKVTYIGYDAFYNCQNLAEVYNCCDLEIICGDSSNGSVARYAYFVYDADGNVLNSSGENIIDTEDGFRFIYQNGEYVLIAYRGEERDIILPVSINGSEYRLYCFTGGVNITIPEGISSIGESAFYKNSTVESISVPSTVRTIGNSAFYTCPNLKTIKFSEGVEEIGMWAIACCPKLESATLPKSLKTLGQYAFYETEFYANEENWKNGMLMSGSWLIGVKPETKYLSNIESIEHIAIGALDQCYSLKNMIWLNKTNVSNSALPSNVETLVINDIDEYTAFIQNTVTLKNIIITDNVDVAAFMENSLVFCALTDVTIYVESNEEDLRWDDNFPGWNNGNRVVYGEDWIIVNFYDENGNLVSSEPRRTSDIIRRPVLVFESDNGFVYELIGWDLDGDGKADSVPATSITDIEAYPVLRISCILPEGSVFSNLSGKFTSYASQGNAKVSLFENGEEIYILTFEREDTIGLVTRAFTFEDIDPGIYDLVITCDGHLTYTVKNILNYGKDIYLTNSRNQMVAEIVLKAGDVNCDGVVDLKDVVALTSSSTYGKNKDEAANKSADINGDGCFDLKDLIIITSEANYGQENVEIEY